MIKLISRQNGFCTLIMGLIALTCVTAQAQLPEYIANDVPELNDYELIYHIQIPEVNEWSGNPARIKYLVDKSAGGPSAVDRVAYVMELDEEWVWVSFDTYSGDIKKLGIPTKNIHPVAVQQKITNMNIYSNVDDEDRITTGEGLTGGNIEFWGGNYAPANALEIPNADGATFDFGDTMAAGGHGSMQVHNHEAGQVLFAYNNWGSNNTGATGGLGIGNSDSGNPDWTFSGSSADYFERNFYVLARPGEVPNLDGAPKITGSRVSTTGTSIILSFSEPLSQASDSLENFSIEGLTVEKSKFLDAKVSDRISLTTSLQEAGKEYTINITGVSDKHVNPAPLKNPTHTFTSYSKPGFLSLVPDNAEYQLVYHLSIPETAGAWNQHPVPYGVNDTHLVPGTFDRVAYAMELDGEWVFVSFDAFTDDIKKIGVPTMNVHEAPVQSYVNNMEIYSSLDSITTGSFDEGNIEFWGGNYGGANALEIPNADGANFDFGDQMVPGTYGSMQVHNYQEGEVVFALNRFGWGDGALDVGIGNNPDGNPDYTFAGTAFNYVERSLYVFVAGIREPVLIPTLSYVLNGDGTATVTFEGTLQLAAKVNGPWVDVGATSPLAIKLDQKTAFVRAKK